MGNLNGSKNTTLPSLFIIVTFTLLVVLLIFNLVINSEMIFQKTFSISQDSQLSREALNVFRYVSKNQNLKENKFSTQAISHLSDVKSLFITFRRSLYAAFFVFAAAVVLQCITKQTKLVLSSVRTASKAMLMTIASFAFIAVLFFEKFYYAIHMIFFRNKLWLFPEDDLLIRLFPQNFFFLYALIIYTSIFTITLFFLVILNRND